MGVKLSEHSVVSALSSEHSTFCDSKSEHRGLDEADSELSVFCDTVSEHTVFVFSIHNVIGDGDSKCGDVNVEHNGFGDSESSVLRAVVSHCVSGSAYKTFDVVSAEHSSLLSVASEHDDELIGHCKRTSSLMLKPFKVCVCDSKFTSSVSDGMAGPVYHGKCLTDFPSQYRVTATFLKCFWLSLVAELLPIRSSGLQS